MQELYQLNKAVVTRFNKAFIEKGDMQAFEEIIDPGFINHTAAPGIEKGPEGMIRVIMGLRNSFPDITVEIHEQVAENDLVVTRKTLHATHTGEFMGIAPTGKTIKVPVIDMVQLHNGRYIGHWGRDMLVQCIREQLV